MAMSNFLATATIATRRFRLLLPLVRATNQAVMSLPVCKRTQRQASWMRWARTTAFPALLMPCSCCSRPLLYGLGGRPAKAAILRRSRQSRHNTLPRQDHGGLAPDTGQPLQHGRRIAALLRWPRRGTIGDCRFRHRLLDLRDVLQHQFETRQLALDLSAASGGERLAVTGTQLGQRRAPVMAERPIAPHAVQREQTLDAVDVAHSLLSQS